jgi:hypothetical protein
MVVKLFFSNKHLACQLHQKYNKALQNSKTLKVNQLSLVVYEKNR